MKKVRLAMLSAAMFLGMATVAHAQDPQQAGRGNRPNMAAMLFQGITLSPAQEAKRDSIEAKYRAISVLPGATEARIWEPEPGVVYVWETARV